MRHIIASAVALLLLSASSACLAQDFPVLFADFIWGTPRSELEKLPGITPGQNPAAGDLLLPEANYAGEIWNVNLEFADGRLVRVSLLARYSRERMDKVTRRLRTDGFEMLSVMRDSASLDLVLILKTKGADAVREEWRAFMQGASPQRLIYAWFATASLSEGMKTMASSLRDLMLVVPAETREAEVTLLGDPATGKPGVLLVDFSFPLMDGAAPGDAGRKPAQQD